MQHRFQEAHLELRKHSLPSPSTHCYTVPNGYEARLYLGGTIPESWARCIYFSIFLLRPFSWQHLPLWMHLVLMLPSCSFSIFVFHCHFILSFLSSLFLSSFVSFCLSLSLSFCLSLSLYLSFFFFSLFLFSLSLSISLSLSLSLFLSPSLSFLFIIFCFFFVSLSLSLHFGLSLSLSPSLVLF